MRYVPPSITLSSTDYGRLQQLMRTMIGSRTVTAAILRRKLGSSSSAPSSTLSPDRAVSGRRVRFSIDGKTVEERTLAWHWPELGDDQTLSLLSPRGLALLGLMPGESIAYRTEGGRSEFIRVESISSQQDSTRRPIMAAVPRRRGVPVAIAYALPVPTESSAGVSNV